MQAYQAIIWLDASSSESLNKELQSMSKVAPELFLALLAGGKEILLILDNLQDISLVQQSNAFSSAGRGVCFWSHASTKRIFRPSVCRYFLSKKAHYSFCDEAKSFPSKVS